MSEALTFEAGVGIVVLAIMVVAAVVLLARLSCSTRLHAVACALFPISQIACIAALFALIVIFDAPPSFVVAGAVLGIACIPVDVALFSALLKAEDKDLMRDRARLLEKQTRTQEEGARELAAAVASARRIRSEVSDQLHRVDEMLSRNEVRESEQGMDDAVVLMGKRSFKLCEHDALDALVGMKKRELERAGVEVSCSLKVPRNIAVPSAELCALFANMLDNASHACAKVPEGGRFVTLRASVRGSYFVVDLRNSALPTASMGSMRAEPNLHDPARHIYLATERMRDGALDEHGWGMSVIEFVAESHDGAVSFESEGGQFRISVMLHLETHA